MSIKGQNIPENQEIDLLTVFGKTGNFFEWINALLFKIIRFFIKNTIVVALLIIVGFGLGKYLDASQKSFNNQIVVSPNFESADFLYAKINLLKSKIAERDTVYIKNEVGITKPAAIKNISIKAITDVYQFIEERDKNFDLISLMAEDEGLKKVLNDTITSKNFTYHKISFTANKLISDAEVIQPLLKYLNNSDYYNKIQAISLKNLQQEIVQNDTILSQINAVLNGFSSKVIGAQKSDKLVYYNENIQLNDVLKTKEELIKNQGKNRVKLVRFDKTIKEISNTLNIKSNNKFYGKLVLVLPVLFVMMFVFIRFFIAFYKKEALKAQQI